MWLFKERFVMVSLVVWSMYGRQNCSDVTSDGRIIAYDCLNRNASVATVSLRGTEECKQPDLGHYQEKDVDIQILQAREYEQIHIFHCKINFFRSIFHCGMHSHSSGTENTIAEYLVKLTQSECIEIHRNKQYKLHGVVIELEGNSSKSVMMNIVGSRDEDGTCKDRGGYSDRFGTYSGVTVEAQVTISLLDYYSMIQLDTKRIELKYGDSCPLGAVECVHPTFGYTSWEYAPIRGCTPRTYDVLFEGSAKESKLRDLGGLESRKYITVSHEKFIVMVALTTLTPLCSEEVYGTTHPRLFIAYRKMYGYYFSGEIGVLNSQNIDMFLYVNTKFLYAERYIGQQISEAIRRTDESMCNLRRKMLENRLMVARHSPHVFGNLYSDEPGHYTIMAGEVAHVFKCAPVLVRLRKSSECYQELPITYLNESRFVQPVSRIIIDHGQKVACTLKAPVLYQFGSQWIRPMPIESIAPTPDVLNPNRGRISWRYSPINNLGIAGLYNEDELRKLNRFLMGPADASGVLSVMATNINHKGLTADGSIDIKSIFTEYDMQGVAGRIWNYTWSGFGVFGQYAAGVLGVYYCWKFGLGLLNYMVRSKMLYNYFGWSIRLFAAITSSITHYFIDPLRVNFDETHVRRRRRRGANRNPEEKNNGRQSHDGGDPDEVIVRTEGEGEGEVISETDAIPNFQLRAIEYHPRIHSPRASAPSQPPSYPEVASRRERRSQRDLC